MYLIPALLVTKSLEDISPKVGELGKMYVNDLPSSRSLQSELHCWYLKWKQQEQEHGQVSLPKIPSFTLPHAHMLHLSSQYQSTLAQQREVSLD